VQPRSGQSDGHISCTGPTYNIPLAVDTPIPSPIPPLPCPNNSNQHANPSNLSDRGADVDVAVWISRFALLLILINVFGVLGYVEEEVRVSLVKLGTIIVFLIMALVFVLGGGPCNGAYHSHQGAKTWYHRGAFAAGFVGFCSVFIHAAFSFSDPELVGLATAETRNPQKTPPGVIQQVFWRSTLYATPSLPTRYSNLRYCETLTTRPKILHLGAAVRRLARAQ